MMDWRLKPQREQQTFSDIFSNLDFRPKSWLSFSSQLRYDINTTTGALTEMTDSPFATAQFSYSVATTNMDLL